MVCLAACLSYSESVCLHLYLSLQVCLPFFLFFTTLCFVYECVCVLLLSQRTSWNLFFLPCEFWKSIQVSRLDTCGFTTGPSSQLLSISFLFLMSVCLCLSQLPGCRCDQGSSTHPFHPHVTHLELPRDKPKQMASCPCPCQTMSLSLLSCLGSNTSLRQVPLWHQCVAHFSCRNGQRLGRGQRKSRGQQRAMSKSCTHRGSRRATRAGCSGRWRRTAY